MAVRPTQGYKLLYRTGEQSAGLPGTSPLSNLAFPTASALAGEARSKTTAQGHGHTGSTTAADYAALQYLNRDPYRDLADHQSIIHD